MRPMLVTPTRNACSPHMKAILNFVSCWRDPKYLFYARNRRSSILFNLLTVIVNYKFGPCIVQVLLLLYTLSQCVSSLRFSFFISILYVLLYLELFSFLFVIVIEILSGLKLYLFCRLNSFLLRYLYSARIT